MKGGKPASFRDYKAVDAVNWSSLKELKRSPKHYRYRLENERPDSVRLALGRGAHTAILEPMRFLRDYALWEGDRRAGKAWETFKEANAGKTILKSDEYDRCLAIGESVRSHSVASKLLAKGEAEQTLTWTDPVTGIKCKARPDWMCDPATVDIKTAKSIEPRQFASACARLGYTGQAAFYCGGRALARNEQPKPFIIIAVEIDPPHDVACYELDEDALYAGEKEVMELLALLSSCRESDSWPGRSQELETLAMPAWLFGDDEQADELGIVFSGAADG